MYLNWLGEMGYRNNLTAIGEDVCLAVVDVFDSAMEYMASLVMQLNISGKVSPPFTTKPTREEDVLFIWAQHTVKFSQGLYLRT